jgi:hypothetical protein
MSMVTAIVLWPSISWTTFEFSPRARWRLAALWRNSWTLDGDGVANTSDNCPSTPNANQADLDGDGLGNACDPDLDGDGVANTSDNCPSTANADQADFAGDGLGDACDPDADNDGIANGDDLCPETLAGLPVDANGCSAEQGVNLLSSLVEDSPLSSGNKNALEPTLGQILNKLGDGNPNNDSATCGKLQAFLNKVNAFESQGGPTGGEATLLRDVAETMQAATGC